MLTACHLWHRFCHLRLQFYLISMKFYLILVLASMGLISCKHLQKTSSSQGISGTVVWLEGNLMPTLDDSSYSQRAAGKPVMREVYIFEPTKLNQTEKGNKSSVLYTKIHSKLIKKTKSNAAGHFKVNLPPGKYSVFTLEEDGYFANIFDGQGFMNPVTVEVGKFTKIVIKVNYKAYY